MTGEEDRKAAQRSRGRERERKRRALGEAREKDDTGEREDGGKPGGGRLGGGSGNTKRDDDGRSKVKRRNKRSPVESDGDLENPPPPHPAVPAEGRRAAELSTELTGWCYRDDASKSREECINPTGRPPSHTDIILPDARNVAGPVADATRLYNIVVH